MAEETGARLDVADLAANSGWDVESTYDVDVFTKDDTVIEVRYTVSDGIESAVKQDSTGESQTIDQDIERKPELLRAWLAGHDLLSVVQPRQPRRKLSWVNEKWLHKPTQEMVPDDDPRAPSLRESKVKAIRDVWYLAAVQADVEDGYYRRDLDPSTAGDAEPSYWATWNPIGGPQVTLVRGSREQVYKACVDHHKGRGAT